MRLMLTQQIIFARHEQFEDFQKENADKNLEISIWEKLRDSDDEKILEVYNENLEILKEKTTDHDDRRLTTIFE